MPYCAWDKGQRQGEQADFLQRSRGLCQRISMTVLYTIGYGGRHPQHFLAMLTQHRIELVCDVRAEPRRAYRGIYTFNPEKGRGPLPHLLAQADIQYRWFPELGNPDRQDPEISAFERLMAQEA